MRKSVVIILSLFALTILAFMYSVADHNYSIFIPEDGTFWKGPGGVLLFLALFLAAVAGVSRLCELVKQKISLRKGRPHQ